MAKRKAKQPEQWAVYLILPGDRIKHEGVTGTVTARRDHTMPDGTRVFAVDIDDDNSRKRYSHKFYNGDKVLVIRTWGDITGQAAVEALREETP